MSKQKQRQAYARGYRDSLIDHNQFLKDLQRTIYAFQLKLETTAAVGRDDVIDKMTLLRQAIEEYRDEAFTDGGYTSASELRDRVRTIMDLQDMDNNDLDDESNDIIDLDSSVMKFISKRDIDFDDE